MASKCDIKETIPLQSLKGNASLQGDEQIIAEEASVNDLIVNVTRRKVIIVIVAIVLVLIIVGILLGTFVPSYVNDDYSGNTECKGVGEHSSLRSLGTISEISPSTSTCSPCDDVSVMLSSSFNDIHPHTTTRFALSSISHLAPNAEFINSTILSTNESYPRQLRQFLEPAVGNDSHWLLCYRASFHGWDVSFFHSGCDGKRDTVTIIKKDRYVFGGYTDIPWESSGGFGSTSNAFIFSIHNKEGLAPFKSMMRGLGGAIYRDASLGPTFGYGFDICIENHANNNTDSYTEFGYSYHVPSGVQDPFTILAGTDLFSPDEVEVFYLDPPH